MKNLFKDIHLWELLQKDHEQVTRWSKFLEEDSKLRPQNNLHHIVSLVHVATWISAILEDHVDFDRGFVLSAINIHEHGEAITKKDALYDEKDINPSDDVLEYELLMFKLKESFPDNSQLLFKLEKTFLLQFATQEHKWGAFPSRAQNILLNLKKNHYPEAQIFNAIERYEYLYYCFEQNSVHNEELLMNVLENQAHYLDVYASSKGIPGFINIWTPEHSKEAKLLLNGI